MKKIIPINLNNVDFAYDEKQWFKPLNYSISLSLLRKVLNAFSYVSNKNDITLSIDEKFWWFQHKDAKGNVYSYKINVPPINKGPLVKLKINPSKLLNILKTFKTVVNVEIHDCGKMIFTKFDNFKFNYQASLDYQNSLYTFTTLYKFTKLNKEFFSISSSLYTRFSTSTKKGIDGFLIGLDNSTSVFINEIDRKRYLYINPTPVDVVDSSKLNKNKFTMDYNTILFFKMLNQDINIHTENTTKYIVLNMFNDNCNVQYLSNKDAISKLRLEESLRYNNIKNNFDVLFKYTISINKLIEVIYSADSLKDRLYMLINKDNNSLIFETGLDKQVNKLIYELSLLDYEIKENITVCLHKYFSGLLLMFFKYYFKKITISIVKNNNDGKTYFVLSSDSIYNMELLIEMA